MRKTEPTRQFYCKNSLLGQWQFKCCFVYLAVFAGDSCQQFIGQSNQEKLTISRRIFNQSLWLGSLWSNSQLLSCGRAVATISIKWRQTINGNWEDNNNNRATPHHDRQSIQSILFCPITVISHWKTLLRQIKWKKKCWAFFTAG